MADDATTTLEPVSIPRDAPKPLAEDFDALMQQAVGWLPVWCSGSWTNFNPNDPGIMILEQLLYALTELSYRANLPIDQLLADEDGKMPWKSNCLYTPVEVMPMAPLTAADHARVLYDAMPALLYVSVAPLGSDVQVPVSCIGGRLQVRLGVDPDADLSVRKGAQLEAWHILCANRALGERFERIDLIPPVVYQFTASLELDPGYETEIAVADLYLAVKKAVLPGPVFQTLEEATADMPIDRALSGPLLKRGILPDSGMPKELSWFEVKERTWRALSTAKGVKRVDGLSFDCDAEYSAGSPSGVVAFYVPSKTFRLTIARRPPIRNKALIPQNHAVGQVLAMNDGRVQMLIGAGGDSPSVDITRLLPSSGWRMPSSPEDTPGLGSYHSIQNNFPPVFGIQENGLPSDASQHRQAQARQLKGYLAVFEQLMADFFAQLVHTRDLLSCFTQRTTTYVQPLNTVPGIMPLLAGYNDHQEPMNSEQAAERTEAYWSDLNNPYLRGLGALAETPEEFLSNRNAVLDHLLARFAESYPKTQNATYETIANKQSLLDAYRGIGYGRAVGVNLAQSYDPAKPWPRSGLEAKMRLLLRRDGQWWNAAPAHAPGGVEGSEYYFAIEHLVFLPRSPGTPPPEIPQPAQVAEAVAARTDTAPVAGPAGQPAAATTSEPTPAVPVPSPSLVFQPGDFQFQMTHVLVNWTVNPLTPLFQGYVEDLIRQNAPAHLWHHFVWLETLPAPDPAVAEIRSMYEAWVKSGFAPLELTDPAAPVAAGQAIPVKPGTPAANLFNWVRTRAAAVES